MDKVDYQAIINNLRHMATYFKYDGIEQDLDKLQELIDDYFMEKKWCIKDE